MSESRNEKAERLRRQMREKIDGGGGGSDPAAPLPQMPDGCPVIPLAATGTHVVLLDSARHLRRVRNCDVMREAEQLAICARNLAWLEANYPVFRQSGAPKRGGARETVPGAWNRNAFGRDLFVVAAAQGSGFAPERERGPGAYPGRANDLILHCGDCLWVDGWVKPLGLRDGYAYTVGEEALPRPWPQSVELGEGGPGARLYAYYSQWRFRREIG
jgi:hypothetical protein